MCGAQLGPLARDSATLTQDRCLGPVSAWSGWEVMWSECGVLKGEVRARNPVTPGRATHSLQSDALEFGLGCAGFFEQFIPQCACDSLFIKARGHSSQ